MYLKELTLRGFKSFASATTLRFEPGITAVVGPNGSGKSNIVDALTWVMGEQGAKNLRGSSMEDVIFAGTSSRPPLGRAQVSLTIDNTDRTLDIDYTEVTISRTIYRNGGSEYAINGSQCRLLDIQELLSDTGLGQQMHVIVGQGRLDAILKADPTASSNTASARSVRCASWRTPKPTCPDWTTCSARSAVSSDRSADRRASPVGPTASRSACGTRRRDCTPRTPANR